MSIKKYFDKNIRRRTRALLRVRGGLAPNSETLFI